jgi:hypothetical protein
MLAKVDGALGPGTKDQRPKTNDDFVFGHPSSVFGQFDV